MSLPDRIFFVRVPKTATTSLERHFKIGFGEAAVFSLVVPTAEAAAITVARDAPTARVISGHYPFGAHAQLGGSFEYVTLSRDPVERVCSFYHYSNHPRCSGHMYHKPDLSLSGWIDACGPHDLSNAAVRYFSGRRIEAGDRVPLPELTRADLRRAKQNLTHFAVVGVVERFEAMLRQLEARYGWEPQQPLVLNMRAGAPAPLWRDRGDRDLEAADVVSKIESMNRLDLELHKWIKEELAP